MLIATPTTVLMDVREYGSTRESLAMLKMLAVSSREIKQGKTRDAVEVLAEMEAKLTAKRHAKN